MSPPLGKNVAEAQDRAYAAVSRIHWTGQLSTAAILAGGRWNTLQPA